MKETISLLATLFFCVVFVGVFLFAGRARAEKKEPMSYEKIRNLWFSKPYVEIAKDPVYLGESNAYAAAMEFTLPNAGPKKVIVLAGALGDASVYIESDNAEGVGGFIGGAQQPTVARAAVHMVEVASKMKGSMETAQEFPYAASGQVRFMLLTKDGRYSAEADEESVQVPTHPFFGFYAAAQDVITVYRLLSQGK